MNKTMRRGLSVLVAASMVVGSGNNVCQVTQAQQNGIGSLATTVTGTWSYWDGSKDVVMTNASLLQKLPTRANKGSSRWTTTNYDNSTGALDVGGWSSSMLWNYSSNSFGNSVYAIPLSYVANRNGVYVTKPSTVVVEDANTSTLFMNQPENGSLSDFIIGTNYSFSSSKVDKNTEWSTDVVMEREGNANQYMKFTMTQGSPYAFFETVGGTTITIKRPRSLPSEIVSFNGSTLSDSTMFVVRVFDNQDLAVGYSEYDYYAFYVSEGSDISTATDSYQENKMGNVTVSFANQDKAYMSMAYLCETSGKQDQKAIDLANEYQKYAYNFITKTETSFVYDKSNSQVTTNYKYTLDNKSESTADGTIMGVLPHQYKYMEGYDFIENTTRSIRGNVKYIIGDNYSTHLKYSGILPSMPSVDDADKPQLQGYIDDFMQAYGPSDTSITKEKYDVNTYDTGKKLNRAIQVMEAAETCGDTQTANTLLAAIERELEDWFTADGADDDKYFYYDEGVGSLFGFPQAYYTVDGMTDHHFHYGYFINAAAQVALRDKTFAAKYSNIVDELIGDVATYEENTPDSRYPFLRYFSTYEGHSWASGHSNFADGNNQESSSEAVNAWAGLILWGQATGREDITDLGVYMYQTEISAVNSYWFDVDGDVLDANYKKTSSKDPTMPKYSLASMVWGGKYTYAAWWTAEPLQIQGINILPMTAASFYYAQNSEFVKTNVKTALLKEQDYTGQDKDNNRWNEIWSAYYSIADPEAALEYFNDECAPEAGDSKAHAYHYIMAMQNVGTPDLSVTSNDPLSSAFKDADGNLTYVAYNAGESESSVSFSDGTVVNVPAGKMSVTKEEAGNGKANYTIHHYLENSDGTYSLVQTEKKAAVIGNTVTATPKTYSGFAVNTSHENTVSEGLVAEDGSLVLNLYYDIEEIRETKPCENENLYTSLGPVDGIELSYYVLQNDLGANVKLLDGGQTLYIEYSAAYNASNTTATINKANVNNNLFGGVYKMNPSALEKNAYSSLKLQSGTKVTYIVIKYGNPTVSPDISDWGTETEDDTIPTNATGLAVGCAADNTITVMFRATDKQIELGQTYKIYVDDQLKLTTPNAGTFVISEIGKGTHKVKVTSILGDGESDGVTASVRVTGVTETTSAVETTSSQTTSSQETSSFETTSAIETSSEAESSSNETTSVQETSPTETSSAIETSQTETSSAIETSSNNVNPTSSSQTTTVKTTTKPNTQVTTSKQAVTTTKAKKPVIKPVTIQNLRKVSKKKIKLSVKKTQKVSYYNVRLSRTKSFKQYRTIYTKKTTISMSKLKPGTKYYLKARAVIYVGKKAYKGKWTKIRTIKTNK